MPELQQKRLERSEMRYHTIEAKEKWVTQKNIAKNKIARLANLAIAKALKVWYSMVTLEIRRNAYAD